MFSNHTGNLTTIRRILMMSSTYMFILIGFIVSILSKYIMFKICLFCCFGKGEDFSYFIVR